jgi:hypothetical protein
MEEVDNQGANSSASSDRDDQRRDNRQEIFSKVVRAGKRTYFFDVKATRGNDYYLTITESKKRFNSDGRFFYEKHKLFLYKEDFDKFGDGLSETISKIQELREASGQSSDFGHERKPEQNNDYPTDHSTTSVAAESENEALDNTSADEEHSTSQFTEVSFDDLGTGEND